MIIEIADWQRADLNDTDSASNVTTKVAEMLQQICSGGDAVIEQLSEQFDQHKPTIISLKSFDDYKLETELADAIKLAAKRIEDFAKFQKQPISTQSFTDQYGTFGQVISPIKRIGAYIPGGRYPLISTALMTLIPANVAGSSIRIACSPSVDPALLAAASLAGATQFIQIGGVQAIAALAYGYGDNQPVDLIVGPGNIWVNEAKKQLQAKVKIDGLAGPSELLALCDSSQNIQWLAYDALAQAEHDPMAISLIVSDDRDWLGKMQDYLKSKTEFSDLVNNQQIELILGSNTEQLVDFSNDYAPEHLMLCHNSIQQQHLDNYGSLFVGANSAVALGDYITGPNHTLPTLGFSRQSGGLNVNTFLRNLTIQTVNDAGRVSLSHSAMHIAKAEGLLNHYESLKIRCD